MDKKRIKKVKDLISCVRFALNNEKSVWNKEKVFSNCSYLRYLVTLYWATLNPVNIDDSFTIFNLNKIAKQLALNFDQARTARRVYADFEERKEITSKKNDENVTYFLITEKGMKTCEDRLEILCEIVCDLKKLFRVDEDGMISKGIQISQIPDGLLLKLNKISREI